MNAARRMGIAGRLQMLAAMGIVAAAWNGCIAPAAAVCEGIGDCSTCTHAGSGCGWCASNGSCMAGDSLGPAAANACRSSEWAFSSCPSAAAAADAGSGGAADAPAEASTPTYEPPEDPCEGPVDEDQCAAAGSNCVWCTDLGACTDWNYCG